MAVEPIRSMDEEARALAKSLTRTARSATLACLLPPRGDPSASLVSVATDVDGTPAILTSSLSAHTGALAADPRCSLLIARPGRGDPLAHPRLTLACRARAIPRESAEGARVRRRFLARHPKAALYADFGDFGFWRLEVAGVSLNGGFGKAYAPTPSDVLCDLTGADALVAAEESAVAHLNDDHADAARLYATALLKARDGAWRVTGVDPDGCDLALGDEVLRLDFGRRVTTPDALRAVLVDLARAARA